VSGTHEKSRPSGTAIVQINLPTGHGLSMLSVSVRFFRFMVAKIAQSAFVVNCIHCRLSASGAELAGETICHAGFE